MKTAEATRIKPPIRKGDQVRVMVGRDKGKLGRVLSVDPIKGRVTVEHAMIIKRHTRPNPSKNIKGGIVDREGPISVSNVMLVCPGCGKHTRVGRTALPNGTHVRICRRCGVTIDK